MPSIKFTGLASGIDSASLIDSLVQAKEQTNKIRQADIDHLNSENDALEELNTKILNLNDLIDKFRTINGGGVKKKATSSDSTVATAVVGSSAVSSSYTLTVNSIADVALGSFDHQYTSASDFVSTVGSGDVTIQVGTGADQVSIVVPITQNVTTVQNLVDAINSDSNASGRVVTSLTNIGSTSSPDYRIQLTTQQQGAAKGTLVLSADVALTELAATTVDQASDANFDISGINGSVTRSSNSISDVVTGTTLNLLKNGSATLTVGNDVDTTAELFKDIVDSYNDIVKYVNENDIVTITDSKSGINSFGSFAKTRVDNNFLALFRNELSLASSSNGTTVTSMADLNVLTNRDGTIDFDIDKFKEKVGLDPIGTEELLTDFADSIGGTAGVLYDYTKLGGTIDIAQTSNKTQIDSLNEKIKQLERASAKLRENLEGQFSRLENVIGSLNSKQSALTGVLAGLR